jgi:ABC-type polysaccharide/polyol phosphate transport system ATPase subunit
VARRRRKNVFLNGAILGMKKKEIESKFDEIVAFSEVATLTSWLLFANLTP